MHVTPSQWGAIIFSIVWMRVIVLVPYILHTHIHRHFGGTFCWKGDIFQWKKIFNLIVFKPYAPSFHYLHFFKDISISTNIRNLHKYIQVYAYFFVNGKCEKCYYDVTHFHLNYLRICIFYIFVIFWYRWGFKAIDLL